MSKGYALLTTPVRIEPLIVFRIAFGMMMFFSTIRFVSKGWVNTLFIQPRFFFTYYGFSWIKPLGADGMYVVFALLILASLFIALGLMYRYAALLFFVLFTYVELIDKTNYLNHYYFISIISMLMVLMPANRCFSLDLKLGLATRTSFIPRWTILTLQMQMAIVYFFAGIAKINGDWLLRAMPLQIWLPSKSGLPVFGWLLTKPFTAFLFSWCGMLFDTLIAFFLFNRRTVWYAYVVVVIFHVLTGILFPFIGVFPYVMMVCATVFLPDSFHQKVVNYFSKEKETESPNLSGQIQIGSVFILSFLLIHFTIQILLPLRSHLYPGKLFYSEEGFRFSWRVMLMEKAGLVFFTVKDSVTGKTIEINNRHYLTMQQEKQMSTQPDMILEFAHYLKDQFAGTMKSPEVFAEDYVSVNGRTSRLLINPEINLADQEQNFTHKKWILASAP